MFAKFVSVVLAALTTSSPTTADFNHDGFVDESDRIGFVAAFESGNPAADFDGDGFITGEDYDGFDAAFEAGFGWSVITLPPDGIEFLIDNESDLARAKSDLVDARPTYLRLRAGNTFPTLGKFTTGTNLIIGRYGDGPNPIVLCREREDGIYWEGGGGSKPAYFNLTLTGIDFVSDRQPNTDPAGFKFIRGGGKILIEGCRFFGFSDNLNIQGPAGNPIDGVTIRRCVIVDSHGAPQHSQGMYVENVKSLYVIECLIDHNGWVLDADRTIFNHNLYLRQGVTDVRVERCIIARPSATGVSMNLDGRIDGNLIVNAPVGVNARTMGVTVTANVIEGGSNIGTLPRGIGVWCLPVSPEFPGTPGPLTVTENIITSKLAGVGSESGIRVSTQSDDFSAPVVISSNIGFRWPAGGAGLVAVEAPSKGTRDLMILTANQDRAEQSASTAWPQPGRTVADYAGSLGLDPTTEAFLTAARLNTSAAWNRRFTAQAANAWIAEGYGR